MRRARSVLMLAFSAAVMTCACVRRTSVAHTFAPPPAIHVDPFRQQIINAVNLGEGDLELKALRERISAHPEDLPARIAIARKYQSHGLPEIALEHLRLACERAPESQDAHLDLARLLRKQGQLEESARVLEGFASHVRPEGSRAADFWSWLGLVRDETGNWKAGEEAYRVALGLAPDRDDLHNNLGYCLLAQGHRQEAAREFREALRLNSKSLIARNNLGIALASNQSATTKDAVLNWQSISDPASAHNNMAAVLIEAGKYAEARKEIGIALGYNQQHPAALNNLRLLSQLDGVPAEVQSNRTLSRWSQIRAAWRRLLAGEGEQDREQPDSGKAVASR